MRYRHGDRRLAVLASVMMLHGCGEQARQPASVEAIAVSATDSSGVRIVTISGSIAALPEWTLSKTPLAEISGQAPPYLGKVGEVASLGKQKLVVQDRMTSDLWLSAADGHELRQLGRRGNGPGEFQAVTQLSVTPGNTIYAFDGRLNRISSFAPDGTFLTTIPLPGEQFAGPGTFARNAWVLDSGRILQYGSRLSPDESGRPTGPARRIIRDGIIQIVSRDGRQQASPIELPGETYVLVDGYLVASPWSNHPFIAVNGNRILYASGRTYELVLRDFDLRPRMVIRWPGWKAAPTDSVVEAVRASMKASFDKLRSKAPPPVLAASSRMMKDLLTPPILPDTLPTLGSALLDENGSIWVARFLPPDAFITPSIGSNEHWNQEDVWHVINPEGTPIARVRLPPETRLLAVRSDRVVVVTRDDSNVESVRVLGIDKATH